MQNNYIIELHMGGSIDTSLVL